MRNKNFKAQIRALCVYITTIIARILSRVKSVIFNREFYPEIQNKITHDLSAFLNFAKALYYWLHEYFTSDNFKNILFAFQTDLNRLLSKLAYHTFPLLGKIQRRKRKTKLFIVKKIRKVNGILRQFFEDLEAIPSNPERAKKLRRSKRGRRILKIIKIYYGIFHNPVLIKIWATRVVVNHKLKGGFGLSKAIFSKSLKLSKKFMYGLPHFFMNVWISFRSLTPKHYIFIVAFLLGALFMQTQMHKSKILIERSTQPSFVSVSANSSADLEFEFDYYNSERTLFWKRFVKPVLPVGDTEPKLLLQDFKGNDVKFGYEVTRVGESKFQVTVTPSGSITPGEYTAKLEVYKDGVYYLQQQRFAYGVLAINTNKATYIVGEEAYLQMAALRNDGHTVCDAELDLQIIDPNGTEIGLAVEPSGKCDRNNVTDVPDYESFMNLEVEGVYQMRLTNKINKYSIQDSFHVTDSLPYEVERIGPTRIYPFVPYDNKIIIKANEDFKGEITEIVPKSFEINRETVEVNDSKLITWEVDMLAGDVQEFEYEFDAPDVSPELYLIGPLIVGNFEEARQWQIAGDSEETEIFTTPGSTNWTVPEFVTLITVESWGAGGGGKGGGSVLPGGGGGGGAYSKRVVPVTPSTTITVVVGSGGSGGTQNGGNGGNGGSSYVSKKKKGN